MTTATQTLTDFLLARIAEDEAPSWRLVPYARPLTYGGTPEAIEEIAREHAETMRQRTRVLAQCAAFRAIVDRSSKPVAHAGQDIERTYILRALASIYRDHPDFDDAWLTS